MYTIKISDFSKQAASKMAGEQFASLMEPLIEKHEKFCVDFDGITRFASPFFNYSFAKLALKYGFDNIKNIDIYYNHGEKGATLLKEYNKYDKEFLEAIEFHHNDKFSGNNKLLDIIRESDNKN